MSFVTLANLTATRLVNDFPRVTINETLNPNAQLQNDSFVIANVAVHVEFYKGSL